MARILHVFLYLAAASAHLRDLMVERPEDRINYTNIIAIINYTLGHLFCVQIISDGSDFGDQLMIGVHHSPRSIVNGFQEVCSGYFLAARDLEGLESLLVRLKRWANHRILCILPNLPERQFKNFLETRVSLFRDAEVVMAMSDGTVCYRLTHTSMRFTPRMFKGKRWLPEKEWSRVDFKGRVVNVSTFNCSTFSVINYPFTAGSDMEIFQEVARRLKLNYRFLVPKTPQPYPIGYLKNGTWEGGLLGLLASGEADIGFCGLWIAYNKVNTGVEMSAPFRRICYKYLVPRPVPISGEWYGIFSPYSVQVWTSIAVAFLGVSTLLPLLAYLDSFISSSADRRYLSPHNSWLLAAGILMQASWIRSNLRQGSCRHLLVWWTMFSLVIVSAFSGFLFSRLTSPDFTAKPESFKDLVADGYTWTKIREPMAETLFNLNDPVHLAWTKRIKVVRNEEELNEALRGPKQVIWGFEMYGIFTLVDEDSFVREDVLEGYETTSPCLNEFYIGFGFRKGSPYKLYFNKLLAVLKEAGLVHRTMMVSQERWVKKQRYMTRVTQLTKNKYRMTALTLASLKGIFEFWSSGLLIALLVFTIEMTSERISKFFSYLFRAIGDFFNRLDPRNYIHVL